MNKSSSSLTHGQARHPAHLGLHRAGLRSDVSRRYETLRARGVADKDARNIAAAQASVYGATKPRPRPGVYRRELDIILAARPSVPFGLTP